ncbi:MAG: hypothetical protein ABF321_09630, partial [Bacteroidia bacterium]
RNNFFMKQIQVLSIALLMSSASLSQALQPTGTMYNGEIVFSQEPQLMESLLQVYNIDTTGLEVLGYHSDWDSLRTNFKHSVIVYSCDKASKNEKSYTVTRNEDREVLKKYMVIVLFDEKDKKFLNLRVF